MLRPARLATAAVLAAGTLVPLAAAPGPAAAASGLQSFSVSHPNPYAGQRVLLRGRTSGATRVVPQTATSRGWVSGRAVQVSGGGFSIPVTRTAPVRVRFRVAVLRGSRTLGYSQGLLVTWRARPSAAPSPSPSPTRTAAPTPSPTGTATASPTGTPASTPACPTTSVAVAPPAEVSRDLAVRPVVPANSSGPAPRVQVADVVTGAGAQAAPGSRVRVKYVGAVDKDGKEFDATWNGGAQSTFPFQVCERAVIAGFSVGTVGMRVGGRRLVRVPDEHGYRGGNASIGAAPGDTITFVIDLVEVA